jgi:hypothetical protein
VFYCTSPTECWTDRPFPNEFFDEEPACRHTIEARAHDLLEPHFRQDHSQLAVRCDRFIYQTSGGKK